MQRAGRSSGKWRAAAAALTLITAAALGALYLEPSSRASTTSEDLVLLHGFSGVKPNGSADTVPGGCGGTFGTTSTSGGSLASYFRQQGWTGALKTVGFYTGDWKGSDSCDFQLDSKFGQMSSSVCSTVYANSATEGTNNQDLRNIGCRFAWYIFQNYTAKNRNVRIAAHSMGGLIAHWAIFGVQHHLSGYPSYLYVSQVVTFDTPHRGVPSIATLGCGNCRMAYNMSPDADDNPAHGAPSAFINTLISEVYASTGSPGVPTEWTLMGSQSEGWSSGTIPVQSSLAFPPSWPGYPAVHKVNFYQVPPHDGGYDHGGYLGDVSSNLDATGWTCDNCEYPPPDTTRLETLYHSLRLAFSHLSTTAPAVPAHIVVDAANGSFFTVWQAVAGVYGPLQDPTTDLRSITGGTEQDFQGGSIYYSPGTGSHEVHGAISSEYTNVMAGPGGPLGFPLSNEEDVAGGRVSYFAGAMCGGGGQSTGTAVSGSAIYYSGVTHAHEVQGCIYHDYWANGGPSAVGLPTSDEQTVAGGRASYFAGTNCTSGPYQDASGGSAVFYTSATNAHLVKGCIYQMYKQHLGGPAGIFGFPTSDEKAVTGGAYNTFAGTECSSGPYRGSGASIAWNEAVGSPFEVRGCIYQTYRQLDGGPAGTLGLPTSSETTITGGAYNTFAGTSCAPGPYHGSGSGVYWNAAAGVAYDVRGCIYRNYTQHMGGPRGVLGLPTSDEIGVSSGASSHATARATTFSNGAIYWGSYNSDRGGNEVHGDIYDAYLSYGASGGALGLPVTDEYTADSAGNRRSNFENGIISWNATTHAITVQVGALGG